MKRELFEYIIYNVLPQSAKTKKNKIIKRAVTRTHTYTKQTVIFGYALATDKNSNNYGW